MAEMYNVLRPVSTHDFLDTSTANMDLIETYLPNEDKPRFATFTFLPQSPCTLIINGKDTIRVTKELGLNMDERFKYMDSIVIVEAGIDFYFLASH